MSTTDRPQTITITTWPVRETSLALLIPVMLAVILPYLLLAELVAHGRTDVVDDQLFGYFGWRIAHGARPYIDVWDNKPPGIYWINALGFVLGNDQYVGVIFLCVLAVLVAHGAFFIIAASLFYRGAAALATVLASFYMLNAYYQGGTNRTETYLVALELSAVAIYVRAWAADRWWKWLLSGLLCGGAFLFKQVGLAAWGAMGLHTILYTLAGDLPWRAALRRCLLLGSGAAACVAVAAGALALQGVLGEAMFAVFIFNRAYFEAGASSWTALRPNFELLRWEVMPVLRLPVMMAAAAVLHRLAWWWRPQYRPPEIERPLEALRPTCPRYMLLFGIWLLAALYGALISPHHFRHYMLPVVPPLMLLAAYLIGVLRAELTLVRRMAQRAWVVAAFVIMGYFAADSFRYHWEGVARVWIERDPRWVGGQVQVDPADWEMVGDEVARRTRPDDRIQCWGYQPGVYLRARRLNATRFATTEKLGQVREWTEFQRRELHDTLSASPPALHVMSEEYTERIRLEPRDWLESWLAPWIRENYVLVAQVRRYQMNLYQRRDLVRPGAGVGGP